MGPSLLPYELTFEERPRYLFARVQAEKLDRETARDYIQKIYDRAQETGADRIMIHRLVPQALPYADYFLLVNWMIEVIGDRKLAFVNPYLSNETAMEFAAIVSSNRKAPYLVFANEADAEAWLLSESTP